MKKICVVLFILLSFTGTSMSAQLYKIKGGTDILAFVGKPTSSNVKPVKYKIVRDQYVSLFHKRSGWGIYAFYLKGLKVYDERGIYTTAPEGFFVIKKRMVKRKK